MNSKRVAALLLSCALSGAAAPQESTQESLPARPVNLKVLPPDVPKAELGRLMKGFEKQLGVTCSHCHVEDPATRRFDYASDENPAKATARLMITMTKDINDKYLAQLGGDRRYAVPVTCGSCHQGQSSPPAFDP